MDLGSPMTCMAYGDQALSEATQIALYGVTRVLASVGRAFVCLDSDFRIVHASYLLDDLLGSGISRALAGRGIEELLGADLFGAGGPLRKALMEGRRREGWLAANTAFQRVAVTDELLSQANLALTLAQTRYQLGLSSIVELSQAQFQQTDAAIGNADAQYQYRLALATLNYQIGANP